jgi:hypothetical protein
MGVVEVSELPSAVIAVIAVALCQFPNGADVSVGHGNTT